MRGAGGGKTGGNRRIQALIAWVTSEPNARRRRISSHRSSLVERSSRFDDDDDGGGGAAEEEEVGDGGVEAVTEGEGERGKGSEKGKSW